MTTESRLEQVEAELADVTARLRRLEGGIEREAAPPPPLRARSRGRRRGREEAVR